MGSNNKDSLNIHLKILFMLISLTHNFILIKLCPSNRWCHPTNSSSVIPFSSCLQSLPASGSFPMSQFFTSGGQSTWALGSALVLLMNIQDWFHLGLRGLISLLSKALSRVFSNTTVQKNVSLCCKLCKGLSYHTPQGVQSKCRIEVMRIGILSCSLL